MLIIEYFKNKIGKKNSGVLFLRETHSTNGDEGKWEKEFNGPAFCSQGSSYSRGVLITFLEKI